MTAIAMAVLAAWFALSVANQIPILRRLFAGTLTSLSPLPSLSLFAPDPIDVDYHLVSRDVAADGSLGKWSEVPLFAVSSYRAFWNPDLRAVSALIQVASSLSLLASDVVPSCRAGQPIILVSIPYLFLLNIVITRPRPPCSVARQFMLVETTGFGIDRRVRLGMLSEAHSFEQSDD